jgi:hypothetical protein
MNFECKPCEKPVVWPWIALAPVAWVVFKVWDWIFPPKG